MATRFPQAPNKEVRLRCWPRRRLLSKHVLGATEASSKNVGGYSQAAVGSRLCQLAFARLYIWGMLDLSGRSKSGAYTPEMYEGDCLEWLSEHGSASRFDLTFLDPPFNQGHEYRRFDDSQTPQQYWAWIRKVLDGIHRATSEGGTVYFMQREKNAEFVLGALRETGWTFQNLVVWKKMASAVPSLYRFSKQYQIIVVATKGDKPKVFNRLRIDLPLDLNQKIARDGVFVTDVWSDIREMTSGYFAGNEPVRTENGQRFHKEQSPLALLTRIILASSLPGGTVFDPFAGTGTTLVAATQLQRKSVGVEADPANIACIRRRTGNIKQTDSIEDLYPYYRHTVGIDDIWGEGTDRQLSLPE